MIVNRTGAGVHRDNRREVRFSRQQAERWAIEESRAADLDDPEAGSPGSRSRTHRTASPAGPQES